MGHTHYLKRPKELDKDDFRRFTQDIHHVFSMALRNGVPLRGWNGGNSSGPEVTEEFVAFNGLDDDSHESCNIRRVLALSDYDKPNESNYLSFCDTDRKPYDPYVVAVYELATLHFGEDKVEFSSDGDEDELRIGRELGQYIYHNMDKNTTFN